jgi:hypothetical protein
MKITNSIYSLLLLILVSQWGLAQTSDQQKIIEILDQMSEVYNAKTKNLNFSITNTYRYACSDSIIEQQEVDYHVRKGEYYIKSQDYEYVITKSFFVSVNHKDKQIAYSDEPLLSYENLSNTEHIDKIRTSVLQNSYVQFDTLEKEQEYVVRIKLLETSRQFNSIEIHYDNLFQFRLIKYIENSNRSEGLFRLPNCIEIIYNNEDYTKVNRTPLKMSNYLTKRDGTYVPVSQYDGYELIIQNKPKE